MGEHVHDTAIIGAGPIGIELACALKRAGIDAIHFDKGAIGQTMYWWPPQTQWFSSNERIAIAGVPLLTTDQRKATREEYLAYLRTVVRTFDLKIHTHEKVVDITGAEGDFTLHTRRNDQPFAYRAKRIVLAVGSHVLEEPHKFIQRKLLIVGGKNSAAEAALRCWHAGVEVTLSYRGDAFDKRHVKVWLLPELLGRISRGEIACHYQTEPIEIRPTSIVLRDLTDQSTREVDADFVLLATGFVADMTLFESLGITLTGESRAPEHDTDTMLTNVPGVYVAGTATAGTQNSYHVFLENCHVHVDRIVAHLTDRPAPTETRRWAGAPES